MATDTPMQLGMVGLGRMGAGLVRRLMRDAGVAAYKLPEVLVIVDDMPLTKVGKIDKKALRDDLARRGTIGLGETVVAGRD